MNYTARMASVASLKFVPALKLRHLVVAILAVGLLLGGSGTWRAAPGGRSATFSLPRQLLLHQATTQLTPQPAAAVSDSDGDGVPDAALIGILAASLRLPEARSLILPTVLPTLRSRSIPPPRHPPR